MAKLLLIRSPGSSTQSSCIVQALIQRRAGKLRVFDLHPNGLSSALRDLPRLRASVKESQIVHAMGARALGAALWAGADQLFFSPTKWPSSGAIAWLRAAMSMRDIQIVVDNDTLRRAFVTRGIDADRCTIVRPGVSMAGAAPQQGDALRRRLGLAPDDRAIFAPLSFGLENDHSLSIWSASLLSVYDGRFRIIVPHENNGAAIAEAIRPRLLNKSLLIVTPPETSPTDVYAASNAVLLTPTRAVFTHTLVEAMKSMRPIVATVTPQICEYLEDRHTALLARRPTPRLVARRVLDVFEDVERSRSIADRARVEVYEHFTISKMLQSLEAAYACRYSKNVPTSSNPAVT